MKRKYRLSILLLVLVLTTFACSLPGMGGGADSPPDGLIENYVPDMDPAQVLGYVYSQDQMAVQQSYGPPTRFNITFNGDGRMDIWIYDTMGYTVFFRDGVKFLEENVEAEYQEGLYATTYAPALFYEGMGVDEIVLATGRNKIMLTSMGDLVENGRLMHLEGLTVGLKNGEVLYVETFPAVTEKLLNPQDFGE
jgi:hypothetical protein